MSELNPAEGLRNPLTVMHPDPRTLVFRDSRIESHHAAIAALILSPVVPGPIAIQFETSRNLYLYAWYVYRFYMVAASQAYSTLELALKTRLPRELPKKYQTGSRPMLAGMLRFAIDTGLLRNEGFRRWRDAATNNARERRSFEALQRMIDQGVDCMVMDTSEPMVITEEDQCWDLLAGLSESIPFMRNELAHGHSMLTDQVLGTLEVVTEILNQLYPPQSKN